MFVSFGFSQVELRILRLVVLEPAQVNAKLNVNKISNLDLLTRSVTYGVPSCPREFGQSSVNMLG